MAWCFRRLFFWLWKRKKSKGKFNNQASYKKKLAVTLSPIIIGNGQLLFWKETKVGDLFYTSMIVAGSVLPVGVIKFFSLRSYWIPKVKNKLSLVYSPENKNLKITHLKKIRIFQTFILRMFSTGCYQESTSTQAMIGRKETVRFFLWVDIGTICFPCWEPKNNPNKDGWAELAPFCWARSCFATLIKLVKWCGRIFKLILGEVKWEKRRNKTPRPYHVAKKLKWWFMILEVFCWDIWNEFLREIWISVER